MRYKGTFKNSMIYCHTTKVFYEFEKVKEKIANHEMCLAKKEEYDEAMKELNEKIEDTKLQILLVKDVDTQMKIVDYETYMDEAGERQCQLLNQYLPNLPNSTILYFIPENCAF